MPSVHPSLTALRRLATLLVIANATMVAVSLVLLLPNMALPSFVPLGFFGMAAFVLAVTFSLVGWLIVSRGPANRIGWLFLLIGLSQAVDTFAFHYATYGLLGHPGLLPLARGAAWVYFWGYIPGLLLIFPALLLFPDGRLPSRRWRPVLWVDAIAAAVILPTASIATWPLRGAALLADDSGRLLAEANPLLSGIMTFGNLLVPIVAVGTVLGVVVRFRRSEGIERLQLKWFASAVVPTIGGLFVFSDWSLPSPFDVVAAVVEGTVLPVAVGIAVLRYRLYDIDLVIRRTLVYVPLTALLAGMYAASIGISQRAFIAVIGKESDAAVILSTLVLAATFTPIKNAIQGRVDRSFREANDVERRLTTFTQAVHDHWAKPDPALTMRAFLASASSALKSGGGEAWFETPSGEVSVGTTGARTEGPWVDVPVEAGGRRFGRLELDPRPGGVAYRPQDLAALRLAADRLGAALAGLRAASPLERATLAPLPSTMVDTLE